MAARSRLRCYGLDIETDTAAGGLDPSVASVLAAALAGPDGTVVFTGPEPGLLRALDAAVAGLEPGVVVTWNGSAFDLPFLADRAAKASVALGLDLALDLSIPRRHPPLTGHLGAYRAHWHEQVHLDAYRAYRGMLEGSGLSCGLKAVARRAGLAPVEADASLVHQLPRGDLERYVASDASLARLLAEQSWSQMSSHLDQPWPRPDDPSRFLEPSGPHLVPGRRRGRPQPTRRGGRDQHLGPGRSCAVDGLGPTPEEPALEPGVAIVEAGGTTAVAGMVDAHST